MITQPAFTACMAKAENRRYSSMRYLEYEDCRAADVVFSDDETLVLCDFEQTPAMLNFAADDFERVICQIRAGCNTPPDISSET